MYKKLAAIGDSFSSTDYGLSWPDLVADKLGCELVRASSPGAGNSFYVEKLHDCVQDPAVDLVVVQLTEPSRAVIGLRAWEEVGLGLRPSPYGTAVGGLNHNHVYKDVSCNTFPVICWKRKRNVCLSISCSSRNRSGEICKFALARGSTWNHETLKSPISIQTFVSAHLRRVADEYCALKNLPGVA